MRKNNCEVVRRELDELMFGEECSTVVTEHLRDCASCREFHEQQTKLRQIVGSLGTVEAPADFDFRLRARLAQSNGSVVYWPFARRGLAVAAMVVLFLVGVVAVRSVINKRAVNYVAEKPEVHQPAKPPEVTPVPKEDRKPEEAVAGIVHDASPVIRKGDRRSQADYVKRPLLTRESSSTGAEVINGREPLAVSAAFPIDASQETFRVSLADSRGNAKTISVPTISFGSQRIVQSGSQLAPKRVW